MAGGESSLRFRIACDCQHEERFVKTFVDPKPREYSVGRLRLDPNNPRLKLYPGGTSEKEIIERLCRLGSQSPSQVVKHILTDRGFLHNEIPVVLKESGSSQLVVIDGNRRVAALKMILNAALIPSTRHGLKLDCEKLKGLVPDKIRCWITHTKSDARRIVYRAHNEGTREWEALSKYATHYDYYKEGAAISEIVEVTGLPHANIVKQINMWLLVEAMIEHIPGFVIESSGVTSFERVTTHHSGFPKRVGIPVSSEAIYQIPSSPNLINLIHEIYRKSAKASGFSREVENNPAARDAFLDGIIPPGFKPSSGPQPSPDAGNRLNVTLPARDSGPAVGSSGGPMPSPQPGAPTGPTLPTEKQVLSVRKNVGTKAHAIFKEYMEITQHPVDLPIASAALTRAMIEATLKFHAKRLKCYEETPAQQSSQQSDALDSVATKLRRKVMSLHLPYSADLASSINNSCKAVSELNDVMHKDGSFAARPAVRTSLKALAAAVESLMQIPIR
jgi:hypothetical protein